MVNTQLVTGSETSIVFCSFYERGNLKYKVTASLSIICLYENTTVIFNAHL